MADYDFTGLSPSDFESLSRDLLEPSLGVPLQSFVTGRDQGIDLRHAPVDGRDWIVQCKHFARSGFAKLKSHLKKKELPKINERRPSRYILATSVGLSPANVDTLFDLLSPHCLSKHDIYGGDDLNALLRQHPSIEQAHFKLWLTSEAVLSRVLHNEVFVQSWLTEGEIRQRLSLYVYTDSFEKARAKLESERICILSGVPGVGKTTLAEMLLVEYLTNDWELVSINQNVSEAQKVFRSDRSAKQVFYYDDFLGQITKGDKLGKNEDRALLQLIGAIARTRNKRFILTTREYILAQAKAEHEQLARSEIDLFRFVVKCEDYSDVDKARILANHLYFANVPQGHIAALVEGHSYRGIIEHRNYNPRVIEWMTHVTETSACSPKEYPSVFLERLNNPSKLWMHAFENQISEASRHLLLVLGTCGDGVFVSDLRQAFEPFFLDRGKRYGFSASPSSYEKALDELEGNFIRIERSDSKLVVSFHNPSILDFLNEWFLCHPNDGAELFACATFFEQVERIFDVFRSVPDGSNGVNSTLVREAIDRTLLSRGISLRRSEAHSCWYRKGSNIWDRLRVCCRIATKFVDSRLREAVQEHIDAHMRTIEDRSGEIADITSLLDVIDGCRWCEWEIRNRWHGRFQEALLSREDQFDETLDGLSAAVKWYNWHQHRFAEAEAEQLVENVKVAVLREIYENGDPSDPGRLGSDLEALEEIAKTLNQNFGEHIQWLNERLSECDSDIVGPSTSLREHRHNSHVSSIESLFEALIE